MAKSYLEVIQNIKTFIFDFDGVFTDGRFVFDNNGQPLKTLNNKDRFAVQFAVKKGYKVAVITGSHSEITRELFSKLGVFDVYIKASDKIDPFEELILTYGLNPEEITYMGDDIPDYEVMSKVGLPVCPNDACEEIKDISLYISTEKGGQGCVRDIIEQTMRSQGKWFDPNNLSEKDFTW